MIKQWLIDNSLDYTWIVENKVFELAGDKFCIIKEKDDRILDETFDVMLDDEEGDLITEHGCKYLVFELGEWVYYSEFEEIKLNPLRYIGRESTKSFPYPHLGVHGMYELCNGSRKYKDWCKKAKFLGIDTLAICEYNTLAGVLQFQLDCVANGIKSIIGITANVKDERGNTYSAKLYAKDQLGWNAILLVGKAINVDNNGFIEEQVLLDLGKSGSIYCVLDRYLKTDGQVIFSLYYNQFGSSNVFCQLDSVQWKSDERDQQQLDYIKSLVTNNIPSALICDSYYLDKTDSRIKTMLNSIGKISRDNKSDDQHFKTRTEITNAISDIFEDPERGIRFVNIAFDNTNTIAENCNFKIKTGEFHLPEYKLTEVEDMLYEDKYTLFWNLIDLGLEKYVVSKGKDPDLYLDRIQEEFNVIEQGNFLSYFLILWDIISWAEKQGILIGAGRGSAGGSCIAYFLGITKLDPIEYDLLFERFLNVGRLTKSLPDIDTDIAGQRRDEVKRYIEQRYGEHLVCSIGTYGTLKIKSALRELTRLKGELPHTVNYYAAMMEESTLEYEYLFKLACSNSRFKEFFQNNYEAVNDIPLLLGSPKNNSVHAAGVIIAPDVYNAKSMTLYDWAPVKKLDGVLISEWDGVQLDACGFLKADILGLAELDKFSDMLALIKSNGKEVPDIYNLDTNDPEVYDLFHRGLTQDVFQFNTDGMTSFTMEVKPESIKELADINALYRPGAMESGAHHDYVKIKFGKKEPEYDFGLKEVTKDTGGLYIYQEQIMKAVQVLGGFTLAEADDIRSAMGKKNFEKIMKSKGKFIEGAELKGCSTSDAEMIWKKLEVFAGYGFNKSHATTYSYMGYIGQYLKCHYPVEFWTVALQYSSEDDLPKRLGELNRFEGIELRPPDINKSGNAFIPDFEKGLIYWSIGKIKNVGDVALGTILEERNKSGKFFTMEEFLSRINKSKVNKTAVTNLILAGCFDEIEGLKTIRDRKNLLIQFHASRKETLPEEYSQDSAKLDLFWFLKQRNVSNSGKFNYESIISIVNVDDADRYYLTPDRIELTDNLNCQALTMGVLIELVIRKSSKGGEFAQLKLDHNSYLMSVIIWNEAWEKCKDQVVNSEGKVVVVQGKIQFDKYRNKQIIYVPADGKVEVLA